MTEIKIPRTSIDEYMSMLEWCDKHLGPTKVDYREYRCYGYRIVEQRWIGGRWYGTRWGCIKFANDADATMFKLRWS